MLRMAIPIFGRSVNPIPARRGQIIPLITTVTEGDWTEGYCQNGEGKTVRIEKDLKSLNRF